MSRERERALRTFQHVESMGETVPGEYRTLVLGLPVLLRTAGLLQTMAYLLTRKPPEAQALLGHLGTSIGRKESGNALIGQIAKASSGDYLALTAEALASADWYVRHVQARPAADGATT